MQAGLSVKCCYYSHRWVCLLQQAEDEYVDQFPRSERCAAAALVLVYVRTLLAYVVLVSRVRLIWGSVDED